MLGGISANLIYQSLQKYPFISCPVCEEKVETSQVSLVGAELKCPACLANSKAMEWQSSNSRKDDLDTYWHDADVEPEHNTIQKKATERTVSWFIPAQKGGFMKFIFPAFWLTFITFFTGVLFLTGDDSKQLLAMQLFTIPFWIVGFVMLYFSLKSYFAVNEITLTPDKLAHTNTLFGRKVTSEFDRSSALLVEQYSAYTQNNVPVYSLKISSSKGVVKFGGGLSNQEQAWFVKDFKQYLSQKKQPTSQREKLVSLKSEKQREVIAPKFREFPVFSVEIASPKLSPIIITTILVFLFLGGFGYLLHRKTSLLSFSGAPFTLGILFFLVVTLNGFYKVFKNYGITYLVTGNKERVEVRTEKQGMRRTVESIEREEVLGAKFVKSSFQGGESSSQEGSFGHVALRTKTGLVYVTKNRQYKNVKATIDEINDHLSS